MCFTCILKFQAVVSYKGKHHESSKNLRISMPPACNFKSLFSELNLGDDQLAKSHTKQNKF